MYDIEALRRKIGKEGVDKVISELSSRDFSPSMKEELTKSGILIGGVLNLALIYSLSQFTLTVYA